jgi:adenosylmethionine-8-amino-7-oxononanoate aminotransferase
MIVVGKGLSSGYTPIYSVIVKEKIHSAIEQGSGTFVHGHTYSQNPLSSAIACTVIDYLNKHDLVKKSAELGAYLLKSMERLYRHIFVGDIRGKGLFAGIEFVKERKSKLPFDPKMRLNQRIGNLAFEKGLITYPGGGGADGVNGDHLLIAPPLIISEKEIDKVISILDETFAEGLKKLVED